MLVLGLLLILGAGVITAGAFFDAGETATVEVMGQTLTTTAAGVFVIGAFTMLMFLLGVWALMASLSRSRRKRVERKQARARHRDSVKSLEEEREELRLENERLAEQLKSRQGATAGAGAAGAAGGAAMTPNAHDSHDTYGDHDDRSTDHSTDRSFGGSADGRVDRDGDGVDDRTESHGYGDDRVIDHTTDLRTEESTTSGRSREL